jgi:hypothetical protein
MMLLGESLFDGFASNQQVATFPSFSGDRFMSNGNTVTLSVVNGPSFTLSWTSGMTAMQALEAAYNSGGDSPQLTFAVQYYGTYGYSVVMINGTYDTFGTAATSPLCWWQVSVNGTPEFVTGVDQIVLNDGDALSFEFASIDLITNGNNLVAAKLQGRLASAAQA